VLTHIVQTAGGFLVGFFVPNSVFVAILVPVVSAGIDAVIYWGVGNALSLVDVGAGLGLAAAGAAMGYKLADR
jgi:hypothetical protein